MLKYLRAVPSWGSKLVHRDSGSISNQLGVLGSSLRACKWRHLGVKVRRLHVTGATQRNLYSVLQVSPNATQDEIKKAYYKLSFKYHPDRNKGKKSTVEQFQEISDAYSILGDAEERTKYDRQFFSTSPDQAMDGTPSPNARNAKIVYDFDTWHKQHYQKARLRKQRSIREEQRYKKESVADQTDSELTDSRKVFWAMVVAICVLLVVAYVSEQHRERKMFEEAISKGDTKKTKPPT